ncbi:hypothetical protein DsansV1_C21g0168581 [Dioscorea sansibarensis]
MGKRVDGCVCLEKEMKLLIKSFLLSLVFFFFFFFLPIIFSFGLVEVLNLLRCWTLLIG